MMLFIIPAITGALAGWFWLTRRQERREAYAAFKDLHAKLDAQERLRRAAEARRSDDRQVFHAMITMLKRVSRGLEEKGLARLARVEAGVEFTVAVESHLRAEQDFFRDHARTMQEYEKLRLYGIEIAINVDRPGCVTLVPEVK